MWENSHHKFDKKKLFPIHFSFLFSFPINFIIFFSVLLFRNGIFFFFFFFVLFSSYRTKNWISLNAWNYNGKVNGVFVHLLYNVLSYIHVWCRYTTRAPVFEHYPLIYFIIILLDCNIGNIYIRVRRVRDLGVYIRLRSVIFIKPWCVCTYTSSHRIGKTTFFLF